MPRGVWTAKDERMYEHIKCACFERDDRPLEECKRIAAATVNAYRARQGRTKARTRARAKTRKTRKSRPTRRRTRRTRRTRRARRT
jgi:hypothetical protein